MQSRPQKPPGEGGEEMRAAPQLCQRHPPRAAPPDPLRAHLLPLDRLPGAARRTPRRGLRWGCTQTSPPFYRRGLGQQAGSRLIQTESLGLGSSPSPIAHRCQLSVGLSWTLDGFKHPFPAIHSRTIQCPQQGSRQLWSAPHRLSASPPYSPRLGCRAGLARPGRLCRTGLSKGPAEAAAAAAQDAPTSAM